MKENEKSNRDSQIEISQKQGGRNTISNRSCPARSAVIPENPGKKEVESKTLLLVHYGFITGSLLVHRSSSISLSGKIEPHGFQEVHLYSFRWHLISIYK